MEAIRRRVVSTKENLNEKKSKDGWILPKQDSSCAPEGTWTNADLDVTPVSARTWTSLTILAYWVSDILSVQSWETGSSILAVGLTWHEAIFAIVFGSCVMAIPMTLNGYAGAKAHIPFPVLSRASFGYNLGRFPVVVRLVSALFWHAITTYLAVPATTQVIRSIWPSYLNIPNHLPASAGITTQEMVSYFLFWVFQFPFLLIPPQKLRPLFVVKVIMMTATIVGMTIWTCTKAGKAGGIWNQKATVSGSTKAWLTMWAVNSCTASWSTVGNNIADFTRYMRRPASTYTMAIWFPVICSWIAIIGIVVTSASGVLYGEYVWDPIDIIAKWDGPAGRAAAFFAGLSWVIAQMCVNISANVITVANDLTSLFPKYINIRRGALIAAIVGGWIMVPWKILTSASSLLTFMANLGIFLAPTMSLIVTDFWLVRRRKLDVPALYQPHGRYAYTYGCNWRAIVAFLVALVPLLPGMANAVNPNIQIGGLVYLVDMNFYYGYFSAMFVYWGLSTAFPPTETFVDEMIPGYGGVVVGSESPEERGEDDGVAEEKNRFDSRVSQEKI